MRRFSLASVVTFASACADSKPPDPTPADGGGGDAAGDAAAPLDAGVDVDAGLGSDAGSLGNDTFETADPIEVDHRVIDSFETPGGGALDAADDERPPVEPNHSHEPTAP